MGEAFFWGLVGGSSLVIGGVVALRVAITRRLLGLVMAFGAGVLPSISLRMGLCLLCVVGPGEL